MRAAFEEAKKGLGRTGPNPIVGAVLVEDGNIVARGYHHKAGEPHAEIMAMRDAQVSGVDLSRCTLYSTLEPCVHLGRTGPCAKAIIEAKIPRVVYGCVDPNPLVAGRGLKLLEGARVAVTGPVLEEDALALIRDFSVSMAEKRPYVIVKAGMTLDARIATKSGESKWITSEAARARGHRLRAEAQAIAVGVGTVLKDDPTLTAHGIGPDPLRLVFDTTLRTPARRKLVPGTIFLCAKGASLQRERAIEKAGGTVLRMSGTRVDVKLALQRLYKERGIMRLYVEGGPTFVGSLFDAGIVDEIVVFIAPVVFGGPAPSFVGGRGVKALKRAARYRLAALEPIGEDVMLRYVR